MTRGRSAGYFALRFQVLERDRFTCQYCGAFAPNVQLEVDHVVPVAAGGTDELENLVTSCFACNRGRGDALRLYPRPTRLVQPHPLLALLTDEPQSLADLARLVGMSQKAAYQLLSRSRRAEKVSGSRGRGAAGMSHWRRRAA